MGTIPKILSHEQNTKPAHSHQRRFDDRISFNSILEAITDAIILVDQGGVISFVSQQTNKLFGYDEGELIGQKIEMLLPERYRHGHVDNRDEYFANPSIRQMGTGMDLFACRKDGTEFPCEIGLSPLKTVDGNFVVCGLHDISMRKQAEQSLQEAHEQLEIRVRERTKELTEVNVKLKDEINERKKAEKLSKDSDACFRMIYENAPVLIDAFDSNGRCTMWNKECERVFGWTAEEIFDHKNPIALFYSDEEIQRQVVDTVTSKPEKVFTEWKPKRKDGSEVLSLWANFKLPDGLVINIGYDITEQKQKEQELKNAEDEANLNRERLAQLIRVQTLGEMAAGIAHEVNQPLAAINSYAQASKRHLQGGQFSTVKVVELVEKISSQAGRAGNIVSHLRSMMQRRAVEPISIDINKLLHDVSKIAEIDTKHNNCNLILKLTPSLPNIIGDEIQIQQVVQNLIRNAVDAMDDLNDEVDKKIIIETKIKDDNELEIFVSDCGSGISSQDEGNIFEAFHTTKESGLGMGLSISKSIIEEHGGNIGYLQNKARGTTFYFSLPIDKEEV